MSTNTINARLESVKPKSGIDPNVVFGLQAQAELGVKMEIVKCLLARPETVDVGKIKNLTEQITTLVFGETIKKLK